MVDTMQVAVDHTPTMSTRLRIFLVLLLGNLGGALLTFVHLRFLDPFALDSVAPLSWPDIAFFLVAFSALIALGVLVWSFIWPAIMGRFDLPTALRQGFGMALIAGPAVALFVFLASERIRRERLPVLFPHGDLAATGARNWRVRTRMLVVFLFSSIVPLLVMSVATSVRVRGMRAASHEQVLSILQT